jgi:hypothetical protein
MTRKFIHNKQKTFVYMSLVIIFSLIAVFGLSLITGNKEQTNIGNSLASATEPADINNDNKVDVFDLSILLSKWNTNDSLSDLNKDGSVNVFDLSILLSKWGVVATSQCSVDAKLVNTCRPWLGAAVSYYPWAGGTNPYDLAYQMPYFDKRLNDPDVLLNPSKSVNVVYKTDFVHHYSSGDFKLDQNAYLMSIVKSNNRYLQLNWKPVSGSWAINTTLTTNTQALADTMNRVRTAAPNAKIMLAVFHEPENDVIPGGAGTCSTASSGSIGTTTQYRDMWREVRRIFDQKGVTNVVWAMNFMGFSNYDCMISQLWPGNEYVDWILWDPYDGGSVDYVGVMKRFYTWLENNDNGTTHAYKSKAWGLGEFGYWNKDYNSTDANSILFWQQAKQALINNAMPRVKLYSVFDSTPSTPPTYDTSHFLGLKINSTATPHLEEQAAFNDFAQTLINTRQ